MMLRKALRTLLTLNDTAERTALAFAIGVFLGFSPLLGLHTLIGLALAFLFRLNKVAITVGVYINNPWTLIPFYAFATWVGVQITGMQGVNLPPDLAIGSLFTAAFWEWLASQWRLLIPAFVGSTLISLVLGLLAYPFSLIVIRRYRRSRSSTARGSTALS